MDEVLVDEPEPKEDQSPSAIIEMFGRVFRENDLNHDGVIDFSEWSNIIRENKELGLSFISKKDSYHIFHTLTTDGNNIDYSKFVKNMQAFESSHAGLSGDDFLMAFLAGHYEQADLVDQRMSAQLQGGALNNVAEQMLEAKDAQIADLRAKLSEMETYRVLSETLQVKLDQKDGEISRIQTEMMYCQEELKVFKEEIQVKTEDNELLRQQNQDLSNNLKELGQNYDKMEELLQASEETANEKQNEAHKKYIEQTNALLETERELNKRLENDLKKMFENENKLNKRLIQVENQFEAKKQEFDNLLNEYSMLEQSATELSAKNTNLEENINQLSNELAEKEKENNEIINQYRPPSPMQMNGLNTFSSASNNDVVASNNNTNNNNTNTPNAIITNLPAGARTSFMNLTPNAAAGGEHTSDLDSYAMFANRVSGHSRYNSSDFGEYVDDDVDDDVDTQKLDKWRKLRTKAVEKRRQSNLFHSRQNSNYNMYGGPIALSNLSNINSNNAKKSENETNTSGANVNSGELERILETALNKQLNEFREIVSDKMKYNLNEFSKSMQVDFKEMRDFMVNTLNSSGKRNSIDNGAAAGADGGAGGAVPNLENHLSTIEKVHKEHSDHVRNQTTELIEEFHSELDDKTSKMDELMSLMSSQMIENEHQTQNYLDRKMDQLFDRLAENRENELKRNDNSNDTKSDSIDKETLAAVIEEKVNQLNENIKNNNEYNKNTLYDGIENIKNQLSQLSGGLTNYFNYGSDASNGSFLSQVGEMFVRSEKNIVEQLNDSFQNSNDSNILREMEEKLDVERSSSTPNNELIDSIMSDKVKTMEILGKQMDTLRDEIRHAQQQNANLADIARNQQYSIQKSQNQSILARLGLT